jgi:hypothetical protein
MNPVTGMRARWVSLLLLVACTTAATGALGAQDRLVTVDFLATDANGVPVTDLRSDEVSVRIGGESTTMRGLRRLPAASETGAAALASQPFGAAESPAFDRRFLLVVDEESLPQGSAQSTRDAITSFLGRLDPRDHVGLAFVPRGGMRTAMTLNHQQAAVAIQQLSGRGTGRESVADAACRARLVLSALSGLLSDAETTRSPVILVFFSGSMYDGGGAVQAPLGTFLACDLQMSEFREVGIRAALARSYVYIVQPDVFDTASWTSSPRAGLEQLAGVTNGRIVQLSGRDLRALDPLATETSAIYVALVNVRGRSQAIQTLSVRTSRPGVTIVARPQIAGAPAASPVR